MYKFIKQYTETITNGNIYPMISLFIFLLFFIILLIFVKKMSKERIVTLSNIPLQSEDSIEETLK